MIVREKEDFRNRLVPLPEWEVKLQEDFPFMEQDPEDLSGISIIGTI